MSDIEPGLLRHTESGDAADSPAGAPASGPTAGQMLMQARLRSGLTLEQLGARVKVSVLRLQALEEDRIDAWPNINGLRAAAATVCRHVQLDPVVILDRLPKAEKIMLTVGGPEAAVGIRDGGAFTLRRDTGAASTPLWVAMAAATLLVAGLVYGGTRGMEWAAHFFDREAPAAAPSVTGAVTDPVLPPDAGPTDTRVGVAAPEPSASATVPVAVPPLPVASAAPALPLASGANVQEPLVVIKAKGQTWISVSDANGVTLLRKTLSAGDTASARTGELPLWVVVGRADNAEVQVRGATVTLEPSVPENVAKFKVQ